MIDDMLSYRTDLLDRPLSSEEKETIIVEFINREILLREAIVRGLHKQDGQISKRLVEKMNFLLEEEPSKPTEDQLQQLYDAESRKFYTPRLISFEHVYFKSNRQLALDALDEIRLGETDPDSAGETFWLGRRLEYYSARELLTLFGFEFVNRLRSVPIDEWHGPVQSGRGYHLIKVLEIREPEPIPQPQLQQRLEEEWIRLQRLDSRARRLDAVRANYEIILPEISDGG